MMAGGALVLPTMLSLLESCKSESRLDWQPLFFDEDEAAFVAALVDTILPRTDTPGALDVKVDVFLDRVFAKTYDDEGQQMVRTEMARFNENCKKAHGKVFARLDAAGRADALSSAEASDGKFAGTVWGTAVGPQEPVGFYRTMKAMALWAYASSEEIGKNVLSYDPIPQEYDGCLPLDEVGNSWSL